jgi:hypothetical protein
MRIIAQGSPYTLKSYGQGYAYLLIDETASRAVLAQGNDALNLKADWESIQAAWPDMPWSEALRRLWDRWSGAAAPIR